MEVIKRLGLRDEDELGELMNIFAENFNITPAMHKIILKHCHSPRRRGISYTFLKFHCRVNWEKA